MKHTTSKAIKMSLAALLLVGCGSNSSATTASGKYTAGTYDTSASGMGEVKASVTFSENEMTAIELDLQNETPSIGQVIGTEMVEKILNAQSTDVDGVSGATITSDAIKTAVQQAIDEASGTASKEMIADGTYTGSAHGSRSEITVEVTVAEGKISSVKVTDEDDSPYISDAAIDVIPSRIVEEGSFNVDSVTGATLTSTGIKKAVENALTSSGQDISKFVTNTYNHSVTLEDSEVDVVVVGGGASGLTAALAAKTDTELSDVDSGLNVVVVESNGYAGGNLALCGGYVASYFGTELNTATGNSWSADELVDALESAQPQYSDLVNDTLLRNIANLNDEVINGLIARGFYLSADDAYEASTTGLTTDGSVTEYTSSSVVADDEGHRSGEFGYDIYGGAARLAKSLSDLVKEAGIDLRLNTTATSLEFDDAKAVTGVNVHTREGDYTIHAKKVILCTGYAGLDQGTVDEFLPAEYANIINAQNASNQSFAQKLVKDMGGDTVTLLEMGYIVPGYNTVLAHYGEEGLLYRSMNAVWVNQEGKRFYDETAPEGGRATEVGSLLLEQPDASAWIVFDSTHEGVKFYDFLAEQGLAWKADTLEELAQQAGVNPDNFVETIEKYNQDANAEGDTEFNTAKEDMVPVTEGPFYAVRVGASSPAGMDVSVYGNDQMQILLTKDGEPIENLYGAGGVVSNGYITFATIGLGTHVNASLLSGAYAGNCVREELLGQ